MRTGKPKCMQISRKGTSGQIREMYS